MPDKDEEIPEPIDSDFTYPDGSIQHECWHETNYTRKRSPKESEEDLSVLRGD